MLLRDEMASSGAWLFRWRSYLPLLLLPLFALALARFSYLDGSETLDDWWEVFCVAIAVSGLTMRALTVGYVPVRTSGRNTTRQQAGTLNTTGLYSVVRHPLYLGNFLIWLGVVLFTHTWWLVAIAVLAFALYYERIMLAEEEFLRTTFAAEFEAWAQRTPAIVPAFRNWQPATLPFSWKSVLAREHSSWFATIVTLFFLEVAGDYFAGAMPHFDLDWLLLVVTGTVGYVVLRWMKKRSLLAVDGR